MTMTWTDERIAELERLWATGASTAEIGRQIDVSKNAVVGKVHRLGLPGRPSPIRREAAGRKPATRNQASHSPQGYRPESHGPQSGNPESPSQKACEAPRRPAVIDLHAPPCQWPFGDPGDEDFHFCGAPVLASRPYCPEHCARAYVREERRDRRPVREERAA